MDSDDMVWLDAYQINDTIIFGSIRGHIDTMIIGEKVIKNSKFPFYISTYSSKYLASGVIGFDILQASTGDTVSCVAWFDKYYKNNPVIQSFALGGFKSMIEPWLIPRQRKLHNIIIDNEIFNNCIVVDLKNDSCDSNYNPNGICKIIWSKKNGLLWYKLTSGEQFMQIKKISQKR